MPPDPERLQRYLLGTLEQEELPAVEAFVQDSPTVVSTLGELPTSTDPLLEAVRAARQCPPPTAETRKLADRLKRLPHEHPAATTTTVGHAAGADQPLDWSTHLAPPEADSELGRLGPYRVFRVLGEGGMGVVFEAEDTLLCRRVALKVVSPTIARSPVAKERFLREARAVAAVEHDNIIAIYQVGEDRGLPFLAMPLLQGETLADRLKREGRLPPAEVLRIGDEVAAGLSAAHARGLVHRDIKPANLWLDQRSGRVKILDFGLARETLALDGPGLTQSGTIVGTPYYMSPEQAEGQTVDPRSDLFSLGSVLYVAATGELPFPGSTPLRVLSALANRTPPRIDAVVPGFPVETSNLIARLMSKTPNERPASAVEVAREFTTLRQRPSTQDRPILPGPSNIIEPQPRRSRLIGLMTALALLLGFGWMYGAAIVLVVTNQGELTIEVDDPNIEVTIRQNDAEVHQKSTQRRFRVRPVRGEVEFHDPETGAVALTKRFELKRAGERTAVTVTARELSAPAPPAPSTAAAEQTPAEPPRVAAEPSPPAATSPAETRGGSESATGVANDGGLVFDDPYGRIDIPLQLPVNTPLTVEFDVTHADTEAVSVQHFLFQHLRNLDFKVEGDRVVLTTGPWPDVRGHFYKVDVAQVGRRRQLAATVSGESLRLFVDGRLVEWKHGLPPETVTTLAPMYLGRPYGGGTNRPFSGLLHRARISLGERYRDRYTPAAEWLPDDTTQVLYDFRTVDPRQEVPDRSGKGHHGKIISAKWVPPRSDSTSPAVTPWTLRSMAEWTIQHGGRVLLGDGRPIAILEELPAEVTRVDVIDFSDVSSFGDAEAAVVGGWPKIKGVNVSGTSITDAGLRRLAALPLGNSLSVNLTGITGEGFAPFAEKDLGTLTAYRCRFSPAGWEHLAKVGRTVQWSCNDTNLADADLTAIVARHPEITKLHVNRTALTDAGGAELAKLVQLEELLLDETAVSDATLERLGSLKKLIRLDIRGTKVTASGVSSLQQALLSCAIRWK